MIFGVETARRARQKAAMQRYQTPMIAAAVLLAVLAGFVDAIAYISLGGFFASFMSGNTTRLGVGLATGTAADAWNAGRSEERRVGKECVRTCQSRWTPDQ